MLQDDDLENTLWHEWDAEGEGGAAGAGLEAISRQMKREAGRVLGRFGAQVFS